MKIAPSILASDLSDIKTGLQQCELGSADLVHVDVMDGHFVPNLSFGPPVLAAIAERTELPLDFHLMVANPEEHLDLYLDIEPVWLSVHWEAGGHLDRLLGRVHEKGVGAGVALNPATPVGVLKAVLGQLDFVVLMSVNPGFSGQALIPYVLDKARVLRSWIDERGLDVQIELDGGVAAPNLEQVRDAGVDVAVVGSGIFGKPDPVEAFRALRSRLTTS